MTYRIMRIGLKSGEVVTERELPKEQNLCNGPTPAVGDLVDVECRGRKFQAEVIWRSNRRDGVVPLRVVEVGTPPDTIFYMHVRGQRLSLGPLRR